MTQPKYAPIVSSTAVRDTRRLAAPPPWLAHRPADFADDPHPSRRPNTGIPGPDQGYALLLAERFASRLRLGEGEHAEDVLMGAVMIGLRRAALFGRAPVSADIELGLNLFGYLYGVSEEIVDARARYFSGAANDYWQQRDLAEWVPESTLRMTPAQVRVVLEDEPEAWRDLAGLPD
ncbi:MAG: hypothetical protein ACRD0B_06445 [Acidimicrobiales bacterium]